jgi:hypothetical protein
MPPLSVSTLFSTDVVSGAKIRPLPIPITIIAGRMRRNVASGAARRYRKQDAAVITMPTLISVRAPIRFTRAPLAGATAIITMTNGIIVIPERIGE